MQSYGLKQGKMNSSRVKALLRGFVGVVLFLVAFWLLFFGDVTNKETLTVRFSTSSSTHEMLNLWKWNGRERNIFHLESKRLVYVTKRRVPNGPDPIHNRRTVKTRQPPSA